MGPFAGQGRGRAGLVCGGVVCRAAASRQWAVTAISQALHEFGGGWLGATDEFYLRQRMQRWAIQALW